MAQALPNTKQGFLIQHCPEGYHGRVSDDEQQVYYRVVNLNGMFPGRILANPSGGNSYYVTLAEAERAREEIIRKYALGEMI